MKNSNIKFWVFIGAFISIFMVVGSLSSFTTKKITPYQNENDGKWKNLKVLPSDISKDSLLTLMKGYNKALGVNCSFCHVPRPNSDKFDFASDEKKEKEYAREMIGMTQKINANYFNWNNSPEPEKIDHVKCVMCHQGTPRPIEHLKNIGFFYQDDSK